MGLHVRRFLFAANVAAIFAFAIWCRVTSLKTAPPPNGDDAFYGVQAERLVQGGEKLTGRTPSRKPVEVLYTAVEAVLLKAFPPSFAVERTPAVIFGTLAIVLAYTLGSRFLDRPTALIAAGLLASLPIAIIYSRVGWEYSEVPMLCMLIIAFAARADRSRANRIGLFIAFLGCFHVNPTILFLAPVPMCLLLVQWLKDAPDAPSSSKRSLFVTMVCLAGLTLCLGLRTRSSYTTQWTYETYKFGPCDWPRFFTLYMRHHLGFCQGVWTETNPMLAWCFWGVVGTVFVFGTWQLARDRAWDRLALLSGTVASAAGYHLAVGPDGFHPGMPRYGLFLVVPGVLSFACLVRSLMLRSTGEETRIIGRMQIALLFLGAWLLMLNFRYNYFAVFESQLPDRKESFWTLRTEYPDPMLRMAAIVLKDLEGSPGAPRPAVVVAEDWWTFKPLELHLIRRKDILVATVEPLGPRRKALALSKQLNAGGYAIGAVGGAVDAAVRAEFPPNRLKHWNVQVGSHPCYVLYRLVREPSERIANGGGAERR